ncbi:FtsQ-type POTRA domain-containing protein [Sulfitobacter sp. M57]|uniref:cell division protein FtsQ/DivIB n=1 Tax=unclassified Sulfitobacter TaxID=196795 RepID=UPI0023E28B5A|nr:MULTISPECIES: cell division protein FtsQ/DivIB [unclassified Sulfitobacter]MDF3414118.1 FtsQ-type POTRA domain-containing protein [Sulfitobacter sp. KE5]MDF3420601.1 FtsQ-type POTRA domain-containing protein [Sulfitobacter sp. KE43]MDF3432664.1 FtsQ-type POTRA domain-containing protein [Sulfitobacter sp. KE42]MDF3458303.1 FtsQ-type POTRA domain-containing protein [Sulfitobacter sp. S74]MDF3462204.1 FtsQ-type POTRA domain-containing protein [Sulfitobacter sp. Ks18]
MWPLTFEKRAQKADPAPSRWAWRMQRLMLTPGFRLALRAGVPFCLTLMVGTIYLADDGRRGAIAQAVADARTSIEERPEFMVNLMAIDGAEGTLAAEIRDTMPLEFPQSSFDLDLTDLRREITALPGVRTANVRIKPGGILHVDVTRRVPVAVWRNDAGLALVDEAGAHVAEVAARAAHPDLPLIAGDGAQNHVPQALELLRTAAALRERVRGVVRMGDRRWDVVLDRGQRVMLPEEQPLPALERVIALERAQEVLTRDVAIVDMRQGERPTIRMNPDANEAWWQAKTK